MKSGYLVKIIEDEIGQLKGSRFIGKIGIVLKEHRKSGTRLRATDDPDYATGYDVLIEGRETFLLPSMMSQVQK